MGLPDPKATVVIPFLKGMVLPDAKATAVIPLRLPNGVVPATRAGRNFPDPGDAPLRTYNEIEYAVQTAELVDSVASNSGALAAAAVRYGPNISRVTPFLQGVRAAGSKMAPVQAALWGLDAGRAVFDPEYRRESSEALSGRMDSYETSTFGKSWDTFLNVFSRPVSTGGAMIRYSMAQMDRQNELEARGLELDERNNMQRQRNRNAARSKNMQDLIDEAEKKSAAATPEMDKVGDAEFRHTKTSERSLAQMFEAAVAGEDDSVRPDGTKKGVGFLGKLKNPDGSVSTEYSVQSDAVKVDGERIDFPTLVPTLTDKEVKMMTDDIIPNGKDVPEAIMQKAIRHARSRLKSGKGVFYSDDE